MQKHFFNISNIIYILLSTKMLELKASIEEVGESRKFLLGETSDDDFSEISFEELLAQEKKDTFW